MALRAILSFLLVLGAAAAHAQNVANGHALYAATCNSCHGTPPSGGPELAANNPGLIKSAINSLVPAMSFLRGMYSDAQLADIAAYIASLVTGPAPGPAPAPTPTPQFDYSDLWFNPNESGWGFNIIQHASNNIFGVIFTYDAPNRPGWYVLPGGKWTANTIFTGALYRVTGAPGNVPFKAGDVTQVGNATLNFTDKDHASFTYSVGSVQVTKLIERQTF